MKDRINYEEVSLSISEEIAKKEREIKILNGLVEKTISFQQSPAILEKFASSQRILEEEIKVLKMNLELCDEEHTLDLNSNVGVDCDLFKDSLMMNEIPRVYNGQTQEWQEGSPFDFGYKAKLSKK
jgi:hypothetical protein